jgi:hypothetical protein
VRQSAPLQKVAHLIRIKTNPAEKTRCCLKGDSAMFGRMRKTRELKARLFGQMMQRFGVSQNPDYGQFDGARLQTAAGRCIHCGAAARCKEWMETTTGTEGASDFCPNAQTFAALSRR